MNLQAFLKPVKTDVTKDIVISDRFFDEKGKPAKITIKAISQEENIKLVKRATTIKKQSGQSIEVFDRPRYQSLLIVACTVNPDFANKELLDAYNCVDPAGLPDKMLLSGEFAKLVGEIMEINGFKDSEELEEDAKNS